MLVPWKSQAASRTILFVAIACLASTGPTWASYKIVVDPGHGDSDSGASGTPCNEKHLNWNVAKMLADYWLSIDFDYNSVLTRSGDVYKTLQERVDVAVDEQADAFVSIHHNFSGVTRTFTSWCDQEKQSENAKYLKSWSLAVSTTANVLSTFTSAYNYCNASACEDEDGLWSGCGQCNMYDNNGNPAHMWVLRKNPQAPAVLCEAYGVNTAAATDVCNGGTSTGMAGWYEAMGFYLGITEHFHTTPTSVGTTFQAAAGSGQVSLTWEEDDKWRFAIYEIQRSDGCWGPFEPLVEIESHDPAATSDSLHYTYVDNTVEYARSYYYQLTVTNETVRADAIPTGLPGHSPPGTPSNPSVVGTQQVDETWDATLDWSAPSGQVDGYHVYKSQYDEFGDCRSPLPYFIGTTTSTTFTDYNVPSQVPLYYQIRAYNATGVSGDAETVLDITPTNVTEIEEFQVYSLSAVSGRAPVRFEFSMPSATRAEVVVYDVRGRHLVTLYDDVAGLGTHEVLWNGRDQDGLKIGSGVYFARLYSREYGLTSIKFVLAR